MCEYMREDSGPGAADQPRDWSSQITGSIYFGRAWVSLLNVFFLFSGIFGQGADRIDWAEEVLYGCGMHETTQIPETAGK